MKIHFGKHKNKDLKEILIEYLMWLIEKFTDSNHPQYGKKNQELVDACHAEINARSDKKPITAFKSAKTSHSNSTLKELRAHIEKIYDEAQAALAKTESFENLESFSDAENHRPV